MGPKIDTLDPKLRKTLNAFYNFVIHDLEIRWLHFQSLLWCIEKIDEEYQEFLRNQSEKF
jgi:hypothetical protein